MLVAVVAAGAGTFPTLGGGPSSVVVGGTDEGKAFDLPFDASLGRIEVEKLADPRFALRLNARDGSGRFRGNFSIARETLVLTSDGRGWLPPRAARGKPVSIEAGYDVLQDQRAGERQALDLTISGARRTFDSPNGAESTTVNVALALFPWLEDAGSFKPWNAKVDYGFGQIRELMARGTASTSASPAIALHRVGGEWSQQWITIDYHAVFAAENQLSPAATHLALASLDQRLTARLQPTTTFSLKAGLQRSRAMGAAHFADRATLGVDWQLAQGATVSSSCSDGDPRAPGVIARSVCNLAADFSRTLGTLDWGPLHAPLQIFARPSFATRAQRSGSLDVAANQWSMNAGFDFKF
jgi:hypothetical protein